MELWIIKDNNGVQHVAKAAKEVGFQPENITIALVREGRFRELESKKNGVEFSQAA